MKKNYSKPSINIKTISTECMMAASDPDTLHVTIDKTNPITSGSVDAKGNNFFDFSSEDNKPGIDWDR